MSTQVETMSVQEVANKLVELCREGKHNEAINDLYDDNAVNIEPEGSPMQRTEGKEAILQATEQWFSSVEEIHEGYVSDPVVAADHFACTMRYDVTYKEHGRNVMNEIGVFGVKDGKITTAQFFYNTNQ
jgi:ketosteroid isomerase-like protein